MTLNEYLESVEKEFIIQMYKKYPSSIKLSKKLGISQSTANRKIQKYIMESIVIFDYTLPFFFKRF